MTRVKVSAPVNMISAHFQGGCVCEDPPGLRLGASNLDIAALTAPRPMLLVSATGDWTVNTPTLSIPRSRKSTVCSARKTDLNGPKSTPATTTTARAEKRFTSFWPESSRN